MEWPSQVGSGRLRSAQTGKSSPKVRRWSREHRASCSSIAFPLGGPAYPPADRLARTPKARTFAQLGEQVTGQDRRDIVEGLQRHTTTIAASKATQLGLERPQLALDRLDQKQQTIDCARDAGESASAAAQRLPSTVNRRAHWQDQPS